MKSAIGFLKMKPELVPDEADECAGCHSYATSTGLPLPSTFFLYIHQ